MSDFRLQVGASITWEDDSYPIYTNDSCTKWVEKVSIATGTIVRLTNFSVFIEVDGEVQRLDKRYLANKVRNEELESIILNSIKRPHTDTTTPYTVYSLTDPRDNTVHYVGISKDIERRYIEHVTCSGTNLQKNLWVIELLQQNLKPQLTVIETVVGSMDARERENYWVQLYLSQGAPLTNILEVAA